MTPTTAPGGVRREVSAHLEADITDGADVVLAVAVTGDHDRDFEQLSVTVDGSAVDVRVVDAPHRGRLHLLTDAPGGRLVVDYRATVTDAAPPPPPTDLERLTYLRPSRYCESDVLGPVAHAEFGHLTGLDLLAAVSSWVGVNVAYVSGSSRPTDGAVATLLAREGVCRDFAHLTAALLRASDIAARVVAVYAPGLEPMDFHAVTEACVDGRWYVVDPTCLAPRASMVRIATGADASDIAFLTNVGGTVSLDVLEIGAVATPELPSDDVTEPAQLR